MYTNTGGQNTQGGQNSHLVPRRQDETSRRRDLTVAVSTLVGCRAVLSRHNHKGHNGHEEKTRSGFSLVTVASFVVKPPEGDGIQACERDEAARQETQPQSFRRTA